MNLNTIPQNIAPGAHFAAKRIDLSSFDFFKCKYIIHFVLTENNVFPTVFLQKIINFTSIVSSPLGNFLLQNLKSKWWSCDYKNLYFMLV
jgi:hypothetical protein